METTNSKSTMTALEYLKQAYGDDADIVYGDTDMCMFTVRTNTNQLAGLTETTKTVFTPQQVGHPQTRHKNLCLECQIDMGDCNPRQLCGKTYCAN